MKNFKSVEQTLSSLLDNREAEKLSDADTIVAADDSRLISVVCMEFERAAEIILNIFFRIVEYSETGGFSEQILPCLEQMKNLSLITSAGIWLEMIRMRADLKKELSPGKKREYCKTILTVYADEYRFLCAGVKKRYGSV